MRFDVLTLFPELFAPFRTAGILGRAVERGEVAIEAHDLRAWTSDRWQIVDDEPYGGGAGMVLKAEPVLRAARDLLGRDPQPAEAVLLSPRGRPLDQELVTTLAERPHLVLLCGRYEGFDERVSDVLRPREVSLGDFVLGGGEVAAMALVEAVTRLLPGVVGDPASVEADSFTAGLLDHPAYTRPLKVEGLEVPEVLRSGHHERVRRWRLERAVELTVTRRPDLVKKNWWRYGREVRELVHRFAPDLARDCTDAHPRRP